ncbi:hypothetical protein Pcinc_005792 [Petrolisthes cinctipes]|uniref:Uncharacterized protein n=1 Tax=Petrolisthes cinctipes TaxID=88211 RepID=A0AAE1GE59_PETCI|nr:hypothetical protein Pcinc_005792 [Petrolisthes cinctipes]
MSGSLMSVAPLDDCIQRLRGSYGNQILYQVLVTNSHQDNLLQLRLLTTLITTFADVYRLCQFLDTKVEIVERLPCFLTTAE